MEPEATERTKPRHQPNWMLLIVCLVAAVTAIWEGLHTRGDVTDVVGYLSLGIGLLLFGVEAAVDEQEQIWIERTQIPAVLLTITGAILLCLSI